MQITCRESQFCGTEASSLSRDGDIPLLRRRPTVLLASSEWGSSGLVSFCTVVETKKKIKIIFSGKSFHDPQPERVWSLGKLSSPDPAAGFSPPREKIFQFANFKSPDPTRIFENQFSESLNVTCFRVPGQASPGSMEVVLANRLNGNCFLASL